MNTDIAIFHQTFFDESTDLISDFERELLSIEDQLAAGDSIGDADGNDDAERLNRIFRCAHSIKGGAATFGFTEIAAFTHGLETLLDRVRNHELTVTRAMTQVLFEALDQLKSLFAVARGELGAAPDSTSLSRRIQTMADNRDAAEPQPATAQAPADEDWWGVWARPTPYRLTVRPSRKLLSSGFDPAPFLDKLQEAGEIVRTATDPDGAPLPLKGRKQAAWIVDIVTDWERDRIAALFEDISGEATIDLKDISAEGFEPAEAPPPAEAAPADTPKANAQSASKSADAPAKTQPDAKGESSTLRVSTDKIDRLINLVGELVINQSMLNDVAHNFTVDKVPRLLEAIGHMERASRELQERVMAVRMLPIRHAFGRFPRLVRDTSAVCGKQIELQTSGEETELDKTVIEAIADPLTHLVRNAIDHGIESPENRVKAGKPAIGVISMDALQEGGSIVVDVSDDGHGLDRNKIFAKAVERGIISPEEQLSEEQIYDLIFQPGFSTASQVTDLSGRGVGMDIVKKSVQSLGGSVNVTSTVGSGTTFRIKLPLTMAILEGLSVLVGEEVYIFPLTSIVESIRPKPDELNVIAGSQEVVQVRGSVLPVLRLHSEFDVEPRFTVPAEAVLVIVENERRRIAILVDELITQSQVVIKNIETNYRKVQGIAGATILGDGRVALILDVPELIGRTKPAAHEAGYREAALA